MTCLLIGGLLAPSRAQTLALSGRLTDADTHQGIALATVTLSSTEGVTTDQNGHFTLHPERYPVSITVSHVAYGAQSFTINYQPDQTLVFRLQQIRTRIPEVLISGKALQQLTHGADYSVFAFEFDHYYMWMLGMHDNQPKKSRLFLANLIGDTLTSIPVDLPASFYRDVFGHIHLVTIDSVFQLFGNNDEIRLLYGDSQGLFYDQMNRYQATLGRGLVNHVYYPNLGENHVYYLDSSLQKPINILPPRPESHDLSWLPDGLKQMGAYLGSRTVSQILQQQLAYLHEYPLKTLFKVKDSLCVADLAHSQLYTIGPDRQLIRCVPLSIHHVDRPTLTNLYKPYHDIKTDALTGDVWVVYHLNNSWQFAALDPVSGHTSQNLDVPLFNAMSNIRFHGGAIYFIYPEKVYPYYQRIYRQVIHKN